MKQLLLLSLFLFSFAGCSEKDEPEPSTRIDAATVDLKYDQEHQFAVSKGSEKLSASTFNWISSDEQVGKIDANGFFTARKIGKTTIKGSAKEGTLSVTSEITVSPYITFITEPSLEFGASKATIKTKEKRRLVSETADVLLFEDPSSMINYIGYTFNNGRMESAIILFGNGSAVVDQTAKFYRERCPDSGQTDNVAYFLPDDRKYTVLLSLDNDLGFNALYTEGADGKRLNSKSNHKTLSEAVKIIYP